MLSLLQTRKRTSSKGLIQTRRDESLAKVFVSFPTTLCPFLRSFVTVKSPTWLFLYESGFLTRANPYHGRRMTLSSAPRFAYTAQRFTSFVESGGTPESFFPARMDQALIASLSQLYQTFGSCAPTSGTAKDWESYRASVEVLMEEEGDGSLAVAMTGHGLTGHGLSNAPCLPRVTVSNPTELLELLFQPRPAQSQGLSSGESYELIRRQRRDVADNAAKLRTHVEKWAPCEGRTLILATADSHSSLSAVELMLGVIAGQATDGPRPIPWIRQSRRNTDLELLELVCEEADLVAIQGKERIEPRCVTVALVSLTLSVGASEVKDCMATLCTLWLEGGGADDVGATLAARVQSACGDDSDPSGFCFKKLRTVPLVSLDVSQCEWIVIHRAELLSQNALRVLRSALEQNYVLKKLLMSAEGGGTRQMTSTGPALGGGLQLSASLLPEWSPCCGGIHIVCVGVVQRESTHEDCYFSDQQQQQLSEHSHHQRTPQGRHFFISFSNSQRGPEKQLFQQVLDGLSAITASSASVTNASTSLSSLMSIRESFMESCLRTSRPLPVEAVRALFDSVPGGIASFLAHGADRDSAMTSNAAGDDAAKSYATVAKLVGEINAIKSLSSARETCSSAVRRFELLLETTPLLKYVGVIHHDVVRFVDISSWPLPEVNEPSKGNTQLQRSVREHLRTIDRNSADNNEGSGSVIGTYKGIKLMRGRKDERIGNEEMMHTLVNLSKNMSCEVHTVLCPPVPPRGVTCICCLHRRTPLHAIEQGVLAQVRGRMQAFGVTPVDKWVSACVAFPLDYCLFQVNVKRQVVGVRIEFGPGLSAEEAAEASGTVGKFLQEALQSIRTVGFPCALEPLPVAVFDNMWRRRAAEESGGCLLDTAQTEEKNDATPAKETCSLAFPLIDERKSLMYPQEVERRLLSLACASQPDYVVAIDMPVMVMEDDAVAIIISKQLAGGEAEWLRHDDSGCVKTVRLKRGTRGKVVGFVPCAGVLTKLTDIPALQQSHKDAIQLFFFHQHSASGIERTLSPRIQLAADCLEVDSECGAALGSIDVVILPQAHRVGGSKSSYHYAMTSISYPFLPCGCCGLMYLRDAVFNNTGGSLLHHIATADPFVGMLSDHLSYPVFREGAFLDTIDGDGNASKLVSTLCRVAAANSTSVAKILEPPTLGVSDENEGSRTLGAIDQHLCTSLDFTRSVFF